MNNLSLKQFRWRLLPKVQDYAQWLFFTRYFHNRKYVDFHSRMLEDSIIMLPTIIKVEFESSGLHHKAQAFICLGKPQRVLLGSPMLLISIFCQQLSEDEKKRLYLGITSVCQTGKKLGNSIYLALVVGLPMQIDLLWLQFMWILHFQNKSSGMIPNCEYSINN